MGPITEFLENIGATVFRITLLLFLVINGAAIVVFLVTRSRRLVNAWTSRLVTLDAILLGAGLGTPLIAGLMKLGVRALGGVFAGITAAFK